MARIVLLVILVGAGGCPDNGQHLSDGFVYMDGWGAWDLWTGSDGTFWPDLPGIPDMGVDQSPSSDATLVSAVDVQGTSCKAAWQDSGSIAVSADCQVHLQSVQLGVGSGPEPDRYGCRIEAGGQKIEAYLHELDCDDKTGISLSCAGSCGGQGVTRGSVDVTGSSGCYQGWRGTGKNLGIGKDCKAFVGYLQLGVGSGAEPDAFGCRYNSTTGEVESYLYELGCDDKGKIALRCDWICWTGTKISSGTINLDGSNHCKSGWQAVGTNVGSNKTCIAGVEFMRVGVGSGPEPDWYGCRYDPSAGLIEGRLLETDCDDKGIKLDCGYVCFD